MDKIRHGAPSRVSAERVEKWTAGPWHLCFHLRSAENDASCPCGYRGGIWGSDQEHIVCEIGSTIVPGEEGLSPPRYARSVELANAHLIASAPELYAALAEVVADIDDYERANNLAPNPGKSDCWQSVTRARAILARARGEDR